MDQKQLIIAVALSMAVLLGWQLLFAPDPPPPGTTQQTDGATVGEGGQTQGGSQIGVDPGSAPGQQPQPVPAEFIEVKEPVIKTATWEASLTNEGALLKSFRILEPEQYVPRGNLLLPLPDEAHPEPPAGWEERLSFATGFSGQSIRLEPKARYKVVEDSPSGVVFRYTDPGGRFTVDKAFAPSADKPFAFEVKTTLTNTSGGDISEAFQLSITGYQVPGEDSWSPFAPIPDATRAVCALQDDIEYGTLGDAEEGAQFTGGVAWGGISSRFFSTAAIPQGSTFTRCGYSSPQAHYIMNTLSTDPFTLRAGESVSWSALGFVGPNRTDDLEALGAGVDRIIDYGMFEILCRPLHWLLLWIQPWVGNWGLAIIILTVFLRLLTFPINHRGYKYMEAMRALQPKMKEVQEKYKNDQLKMNEKVMELYRQEGVSPFGCLPQFVQLPIFFALYRTIYNSAELYHADFIFWYNDLTAHDPYYVLPVIVTAMMVGQQFLMPATAQNTQMKIMLWSMPIVFGVFTLVLPSALGVYMVTSVGIGIGQQYFIRQMFARKAAAAEAAKAKTAAGSKGDGPPRRS